eukprot:551850-Pelagomonas_calceolata.AAC.2
MPSISVTPAVGDWGRGLWNGLLPGEPGPHLDGWLKTRRIHTSLVAFTKSLVGMLLVVGLTVSLSADCWVFP